MSEVIADNPERHRYEIHVEGEVAGFVRYEAKPGQIAFIHTEIDLQGPPPS